MSENAQKNKLFGLVAFGLLALVLAARGVVAIATGSFSSTAKYGGITEATGMAAVLWGIVYLCLSLCIVGGMAGGLLQRRRPMAVLVILGAGGAMIAAVLAFRLTIH